MKFEGEQGVVQHFLIDVQNRLGHLTYVSYRQRLGVLVNFLRDLFQVGEVEQVTTLHLRQCVQHLSTTPLAAGHGAALSDNGILATSTVRAYIRVWKSFFSWCYEEELIETNPAARLKTPKEEKRIRKTFKEEQIERMIGSCDTSTDRGFRDYVILLLLLDTGMRLSEISGLTINDVYIKEGYVKVSGKGRKEREIGIHPEMGKLLWKYISKYRRCEDEGISSLFIGRKGPLSSSGVTCTIKRIQKKSGLTDIKFSAHVFRHTFAKMYLESGGEVFKLSREMGHSSVQVTNIYLQDFGSREARKEHNPHSPLASIQLKKQRKRGRNGN